MFFEFSGINTDAGMDVIYRAFTKNINLAIYRYFKNYGYAKYIDNLESIDNPSEILKYFFKIVEGDSIYLLIDEYDQFANAILAYRTEPQIKPNFIQQF